MSSYFKDPDPVETRDWLESLEALIAFEGKEKADYLLSRLTDKARSLGVVTSPGIISQYANTIPPAEEDKMPAEDSLTARNVAAYVRWNAMAMVVRANKDGKALGGHIATYSSISAMYEVGFDWFFRGPEAEHGADMVYFQGHSSPGIYARAFVEGRLSEEHLVNFRQEVRGLGLSSYPHPWLMPDFWQFPTVSMGLGPIQAIYQARFMKYMASRGLKEAGDRKIWVFMGDGETDEPESLAGISLAAREMLDNLVVVVNCNLQRLDGPVRGNSKIIQELEGRFRGAGWNVIKLIWGSEWDPILERDKEGLLLKKLGSMVDGDFQTIHARGPDYLKEKIFGDDPYLTSLIDGMSNRDLWQLSRGGHDPRKVYAAFSAARRHKGQPTVILVKTVKGFGMGQAGESDMIAHNVKKMDLDSLKVFRDRFHVPLEDEELADLPFIRPPEDSPEEQFIKKQRTALGGTCHVADRDMLPSPYRHCPISKTYSVPPGSGSFRPPWPMSVCSAPWSRMKRSAGTSYRSSPTRQEPSAWRACSGNWASMRRAASSMNPRMRMRLPGTGKIPKDRSLKKASPRPERFLPGSPPAPPTPPTACP